MIPREVYATINGEEFTFNSKAHTVEGFLEEEQIDFGDSDYISTPLTTFIYDGIELDIQHATDFKVTADGKTRSYESPWPMQWAKRLMTRVSNWMRTI